MRVCVSVCVCVYVCVCVCVLAQIKVISYYMENYFIN